MGGMIQIKQIGRRNNGGARQPVRQRIVFVVGLVAMRAVIVVGIRLQLGSLIAGPMVIRQTLGNDVQAVGRMMVVAGKMIRGPHTGSDQQHEQMNRQQRVPNPAMAIPLSNANEGVGLQIKRIRLI